MSRDYLTDRPLYDITRFTTLDFPENLASIFWFCGCNMRCPYCYNAPIVFGKGRITIKESLDFLKSRQNKLTGVVLSGGECTLYPYILELAKAIKELGFKIKIDTNGTNPKTLKKLIEKGFVDYIALDYKAPKEKFQGITKNRNFENFEETLDYLIDNNFPFEARTTVHTDLLNEEDINKIIDDLYERGYKNTYFLQNYLHVKDTVGNIDNQTKLLNIDKLSNLINVELREFR